MWRRCMRILLKPHFSQALHQHSVLRAKRNKAVGIALWRGWVHGCHRAYDMSGTQFIFSLLISGKSEVSTNSSVRLNCSLYKFHDESVLKYCLTCSFILSVHFN